MSGACPDDGLQILIVPGLGDSGPGHWQTLWADSGPAFRRVHQHDFDRPQREAWIAGLDAELRRRPGPTVLVGHSLGCIAIAAWAQQHDCAQVAGALLVAPADAMRSACSMACRSRRCRSRRPWSRAATIRTARCSAPAPSQRPGRRSSSTTARAGT